jgi:hypothetical protein
LSKLTYDLSLAFLVMNKKLNLSKLTYDLSLAFLVINATNQS